MPVLTLERFNGHRDNYTVKERPVSATQKRNRQFLGNVGTSEPSYPWLALPKLVLPHNPVKNAEKTHGKDIDEWTGTPVLPIPGSKRYARRVAYRDETPQLWSPHPEFITPGVITTIDHNARQLGMLPHALDRITSAESAHVRIPSLSNVIKDAGDRIEKMQTVDVSISRPTAIRITLRSYGRPVDGTPIARSKHRDVGVPHFINPDQLLTMVKTQTLLPLATVEQIDRGIDDDVKAGGNKIRLQYDAAVKIIEKDWELRVQREEEREQRAAERASAVADQIRSWEDNEQNAELHGDRTVRFPSGAVKVYPAGKVA